MIRSSSEGLTVLWIFPYTIIPPRINPTIEIGSTQGRRKTLTKVGFDPTIFGLDHHTAQLLHSCEKVHSSVRRSPELRIITDDMLLKDNSLRLEFRVIGQGFVSTKDEVRRSYSVFIRWQLVPLIVSTRLLRFAKNRSLVLCHFGIIFLTLTMLRSIFWGFQIM